MLLWPGVIRIAERYVEAATRMINYGRKTEISLHDLRGKMIIVAGRRAKPKAREEYILDFDEEIAFLD